MIYIGESCHPICKYGRRFCHLVPCSPMETFLNSTTARRGRCPPRSLEHRMYLPLAYNCEDPPPSSTTASTQPSRRARLPISLPVSPVPEDEWPETTIPI